MSDTPIIDLRSDTVTRPTAEMRRAMATAPVGDDVYGEDPTVNELERRVAETLGFEAALFVPTGTMGNQVAIHMLTRPGDEVLVGWETHCAAYESGAAAAWSGVQFRTVGADGFFTAEEARAAVRRGGIPHPVTSLIVVENTHNRSGGRVFPRAEVQALTRLGRECNLKLHLDGARLWNAAIATASPPAALADGFHTVSVCFSKGLGAPAGSALAADADAITRARVIRKRMGGGLRQAGVLAAAALHALDHHVTRLAEDHAAAALLAARLATVTGAQVNPTEVETNIVNIGLERSIARRVAAQAAALGVRVNAVDARALRAVTHLDVSMDEVSRAGEVLARVIEDAHRRGGEN